MDYMTVGQAAAALGVDARTVRHRLEKGQMSGEKITDRLWMIPLAEVERWRSCGKMKPGPVKGTTRRPPPSEEG
jgi:excisionase family DNA binding protein